MNRVPKLKTPEQVLGDIREVLSVMRHDHPDRPGLLKAARNLQENMPFYRNVYERLRVILKDDHDGSQLKRLVDKKDGELARMTANFEIGRIMEMSRGQTNQ